MLRAMVVIGTLCALLISFTYEGTFSIIEKNKAEALERAIFQVLPGVTSTLTYQLEPDGSFAQVTGKAAGEEFVYAGFDEQNQLAGVAIEGSGQGYADIIRVLYGYDPEKGEVVGMYVLESKETPGLGDKIEKDPAFLKNFEALDVSLNARKDGLEHAVVPVKHGTKENPWEIDGITGATISSRAIGNILGASTERWIPLIYQHKDTFTPLTEEQ
jgi:electron transport complex protein RnfG